ncbi:hypothetical protein PV387_03325 [Streptomyces sp. ME02-6987-2C]|uniref:hypothetical protein n=1 Tax=unclassified Streptomyces TaxID=2593676 RepID=UPI0029A40912|nr:MULTISPECIES: hypothetical protein [unclassified Streptomyces]MDX3345870.1 hypothetical protein [Streptomyces sp. ME02-6979A]MDX3365065.1 hypothetical protein [Streptomyces sp. ME02-6987-2C]MDX3404880.1 hypothetical protein [Streptomyces sp. ME02-6977A]MDX3421636.1 hypothetical protein [Streptomyces sp. ME02-6985-2c]
MAADWYLNYGGVEVANHARLTAYIESVGSPLTTYGGCGCPTFGAEILGDLPYTAPDSEDSPAPWYDPDVPESTEFAGIMVLEIEGLDDFPVQRSVTGGLAGGGAIGPARALPRTITVTALVLGSTCCGVDYGRHWLEQVLQGCTGNECDGDCLTLYNCCPGEELDPDTFNERHRRTLRKVALVDGPRVTARTGDGCQVGECQSGADILTVEWVMTATVPWLWTDLVPALEVTPPVNLDGSCVDWCVHPTGDDCPGGCRFAACVDPTAACADPLCAPDAPPLPGTPLNTCFCVPLAAERSCYDLDLTTRPNWSSDVPVVTIRAGATDLRNLTVEIYEQGEDGMTCDEVAEFNRCSPHSYWHVGFVPAGGAVTLDGQIGRAIVECGGVCETSPDVYGRDGMPAVYRALECASYCVCLSTDIENPPSLDAVVTVSMSGRGR